MPRDIPQAGNKNNMIKKEVKVRWEISDTRTDSGLMSLQSKSSQEFVRKISIPQYGNEERVPMDHCQQRKTNSDQT